MTKCPYCGAKLRQWEKYCLTCEGPVEHLTETTPDNGFEKTNPCFIATAAYGSPLAEEINTLRKWRDRSLLTHDYGRTIVQLYYKFSPPIANLISKSKLLRKVTRFLLKPIIRLIRKYQ